MSSGESMVKRPTSVNTILQAVIIAMLTGGGAIGKSAYDDLAERLTESRIEAAALRVAVEGLAKQKAQADIAAEQVRAAVQNIDLRLTALEVQGRQERREVRRR